MFNGKIEKIREERRIKIRNAGFIFIFEYLNDYLLKLKLINNGGMALDFKLISNSVHFLQFILDGKFDHVNWDLYFNKVLFGLNLDELIYDHYIFNKDKLVADVEKEQLSTFKSEIINKCITDWKEIKILENFKEFKNGINIDNFIDYFIKRDGNIKLFSCFRNNELMYFYKLEISNKIYDSEIVSMPFDISAIPTFNSNLVVFVENLPFKIKSN